MDLVETIKKLLTESAGAETANKVIESLDKLKVQLTTEAKAEADKGLKAKIEEAVNAKQIELEAGYLTKVDALKKELTEQAKTETGTFQTQLAARVKTVLEAGVREHGERLTKIEESQQVKAGSALLEQIQLVVHKAKDEITEAQKQDPEEVATLKAKITEMEVKLKDLDKKLIGEKARGNVAEKNLKELRESLEQSVTVTVEAEDGKTTPAAEQHPDSKPVVAEGANGNANPDDKYTPEMRRMRQLAGVKAKPAPAATAK